MGRTRTGLLVLGAAQLALFFGCKHDDTLKPPKEDPAYNLPPDYSRYSSYPKFPDGTLNQFPQRDQSLTNDSTASHTPGSRMGMGGPGQ